jgi:hypothetical protein
MKVVQILGLFNSGTNLLYKIIDTLFDVKIGAEGHTLFWKHTVLAKEFAKKHAPQKQRNVYIVISKNPYFQFHSFKKAPYSIRLRNATSNVDIDNFVKKSFYIITPRKVITDTSQLSFKHCPHYWSAFYDGASKHLPEKQTLFIKYEDILFNVDSIISQLKTLLPLKDEFINDPELLQKTLSEILDTPAKTSGKPRFGKGAKEYYKESNIKQLYKPNTFRWINDGLSKNVMQKLGYQFHF